MLTLQLDDDALHALLRLPEAGMDYYIATGEFGRRDIRGPLVVRTIGAAVPLEAGEDVYDLEDLIEGVPLPSEIEWLSVGGMHSATLPRNRALPPPGYVPARGAPPLLASVTLGQATQFFRYTSTPHDPRCTGNTLAADTYLTSAKDHQFINTGFGAVGRYALPLPVPASYVHDYTLPAGTRLLVGTVAPQFGQSGGGVEVKTVQQLSGVEYNGSLQIDDF